MTNDKHAQHAKRHRYTANGCTSLTNKPTHTPQPWVTPWTLVIMLLVILLALAVVKGWLL